jgi:hypothetical protein
MLYSRLQNRVALLLINVFKNKFDCYSVVDTVGLRVPTKQIRDFSTFTVTNVSRLRKTSANFWTFLMNITPLLRIHFPLLNPTELHNYRLSCVVLLHGIKFYSSSSSSGSLAFVMYTFSARLLQASRCWQALK